MAVLSAVRESRDIGPPPVQAMRRRSVPQRMLLSFCGVDCVPGILHHRCPWSLRGHAVLSCHITGFTPSHLQVVCTPELMMFHPPKDSISFTVPLLHHTAPAWLSAGSVVLPNLQRLSTRNQWVMLRSGVGSSCKDGYDIRSCTIPAP